jgi:serine/threonine protein kinase
VNSWSAARQLFEELLDLAECEREACIVTGCAGNAELERIVRGLCASHAESEEHLEPPTKECLGAVPALRDLDTTRVANPSARKGGLNAMPEFIGGYKLIREVGAGGMGRVFEALQEQPRRSVALKVMRRGLDSEHATRRFRFEAEVLARLEHPAIARIFAAGTHADESTQEAPLPWFALEFVSGGLNLVEYAEEQALDIEQRLELYLKVCAGVQFGHQKGIIHRDLKASNVLIDARGEPKIIDFGIARIVGDWDGDAARLTFAGEVVGTLGAMSPEQLVSAGGDADIDTRTDVYSLGALLFELLTGEPSFDLLGTSLPEAITRVRDREPRRPSSVNPALAPELDWIVLRAMSRDREDRYSSVAEFASDLRRFLVGEPVHAAPPAASYRVRKFIRRNRLGVSVAAMFLLLLVTALVWVSKLYIKVDKQRVLADEQRGLALEQRDKAVAINEFMSSTLFAADPGFDGPNVRVVDILDRVLATSQLLFEKQPKVRASLLDTVGRIFTSLGQFDEADQHFEESLKTLRGLGQEDNDEVYRVELHRGYNLIHDERDPDEAVRVLRNAYAGLGRTLGPTAMETLRARNYLGLALSWVDENEEAELHLRASYDTLVELHPEEQLERAHFANQLGSFLQYVGELEEARKLLAWAVEYQVAATGSGHPDSLALRNNYAGLLLALGQTAEALAVMQGVYADSLASVGDVHPETSRFAIGLGQTLIGAGDAERARSVLTETVDRCVREHGVLNPLTLDARLGLGTSLYYLHDLEGAERELRLTIAGFEETLGEAADRTQGTRNNLAMILQGAGKLAEAEPLLRTNLQQRRLTATGLSAELLGSINNLGYLLVQMERMEEACPLLREAIAGRKKTLGEGHPSTLNSMVNLASALQSLGDFEAAIPLLREVLRLGPAAYGADSAILETVVERLREMASGGERGD